MEREKNRLERRARLLAGKIESWNLQCVGEIKEALEELFDVVEQIREYRPCSVSEYVDLCDLPSVHVPAKVTTYPIWCMDLSGFCLVGEGELFIEHIDDILREKV